MAGSIPVQRAILASRAKKQNDTEILSFPLHAGTHGLLMIFKKYNFTSPGRRGLLKLNGVTNAITEEARGSVLLPIPASLTDNNSMRILRNDLALGPDAAASTASGNGNNFLENLLQSFETTSFGTAAYFLARKVLYDNSTLDAIGQGLGKTLNPKASLMFDGIDMKEFSFEWTLAPTEQKESEVLKNIVNKIKQNALPAYGENATTNTRIMLEYPSTVDLYLLGVDPNFFLFFKTAMISNVNVNYTPNGLSILRGGVPSSVSLSMNFREMDIHVSGDYGGFGTASDFEPPVV